MSTFENRMWDELVASHGHHLATAEPASAVDDGALAARRAGLGRRAVALRRGPLGVAAAAAAAVVAVLALVPSGTPAYAVTSNADGTTTVSLTEVAAVGPANAALARAGARARAVVMTDDCPALDESRLYRGDDWDVPVTGADGSVTVGRVPVGYTMLLAIGSYPGGELGSSFTAPVQDPAPSCLLSPTQDPSRRAG